MKKTVLLLTAVFLLPFLSLFGEDRINQSIGILIDKKSPNFNVERILKKVVLSVASSNRNVRLFSADAADIEYTGIKELNGKVLIKTVKKGAAYQVQLYQIDNKTNLFDSSVQISLKDFGDRVDDFALQIASNISVQFPPKPMRELTKIDLVKIKLSEYESQDGFWSLSVIPAYAMLDYSFSIENYSGGGGSIEQSFACNGVGGNIEATYRIQQWNFMISAGASTGWWNKDSFEGTFYDFYASGMAGYGIFGSLIIIGIEPVLYLGKFNNNMTMIAPTNVVVPAPDIIVQQLQFSMFLQINITKDYYITFSAGPPLPLDFFNDVYLDFNKSGTYPDYAIFKAASLYSAKGMPLIKIRFNFRIFGSWEMQLMYDSGGPSFEGDTVAEDNAAKPIPITINMGNLYLKRFNYNKTRIGLGIQYEF